MGKKKKVDINGNPLDTITIGNVKENKYGWVGTVLLFAIFIGAIYFMPELSNIINRLFSTSSAPITNPSVPNAPVIPNQDDNKNTPQDVLYAFGIDTALTKSPFEFTEIILSNNLLTFTVTNTSDQLVELKDVYLVTYDNNTDEKNTLNIIAVKGKLNKERSISYSFNIKSGATYFTIKEIFEEDYTYIDLTPDENNNIVLTCENEMQKISYKFFDNKLISIEDTINISTDFNKYESLYEKYNSMVDEYELENGISATVYDYTSESTFVFNIDYSVFSGEINNDYYFSKGLSPRVVNFIMESQLFDCR